MKLRSALPFLLLCLGTAASQPTTSLTVGWLTDTHIGSGGALEDLRQVVQHINRNGEVDLVIVSGDVTELDVADHLKQAKNLLDSLESPYHIIPGNHDTKWSASGGQTFIDLWGSDRFAIEAGGLRFIGIHQGPLMRMGPGYIAPEDLAWTDSVLQAMPDPHQPVFVVTHYPIDESVVNHNDLLTILKPFNIQAVLHGHGHGNRFVTVNGLANIMSRSTLSRGDWSTGYTMLRFQNSQMEISEIVTGADSTNTWGKLELKDRTGAIQPAPQWHSRAAEDPVFGWETQTGELLTAPAAVAGRRAVVGGSQGLVLCLDVRQGREKWRTRLGGGIHGQPLIHGRWTVVGAADSTLTCFSTRTGSIRWQIHTAGPVLSAPVTDGERIFVGCGERIFAAFDLKTGQPVWEFNGLQGYVETRPLVADGKVYFGAWDESFYALDAETGVRIWQWRDGTRGQLYSPAACWPALVEGNLFFSAPDRVLSCVSAETGETLWRSRSHRVRETVGAGRDGFMGYARCMWDTVFAFDPAAAAYQEKWATHLDYGFDIDPSMPVEVAGQVIVAAQNGTVYSLDRNDGRVLWQVQLSRACLNTPVPIRDRKVLITGWDGGIRLLNVTKRGK